MKRIVLLGASGSIGQQTLDVLASYPEEFQLVAFSVGHRVEQVPRILKKFPCSLVCVQEEADVLPLQNQFPSVTFVSGQQGLIQCATLNTYDTLVNALVGFVGVQPTLAAIEAGKDIALANKETLVVAGELVTQRCKDKGVHLVPIDSEHSAIFQCLQGLQPQEVKRVIITASGGSFRDKTREACQKVTVAEALSHPNWSMGPKITIDSATMMNKGFEVIEAHWLFNLDYDQIQTVLHRQSVVHSFVETVDGALLAQCGTADMRLPIQYALTYPRRYPLLGSEPFDLVQNGTWTFEPLDPHRFPLLPLAYEAGRKGGNTCCVLNAANESANAAFREGRIGFLEIEALVEQAVVTQPFIAHPTLEELIETNTTTRAWVEATLGRKVC